MINEYKSIFNELQKLYLTLMEQKYDDDCLCGWTWWSLPPKMWRIAKSLGFKNDIFNHEWIYYNSGNGGYSFSEGAQEAALEFMLKKYPGNALLKSISSKGRLD